MQARRNRAGGWRGCSPPPPLLPQQVFAKIDPLPIDNDSEKKKVAKKKTASNFSKLTGNITIVHYRDDYHFKKQSFIKPCLFHWGYKP